MGRCSSKRPTPKPTSQETINSPSNKPQTALLKGVYIGVYSTPLEAKVSTTNHYKTMKIKVPEAEILRTPIKIEKLSVWNCSEVKFVFFQIFNCFFKKTTKLRPSLDQV